MILQIRERLLKPTPAYSSIPALERRTARALGFLGDLAKKEQSVDGRSCLGAEGCLGE
jgi:hypothetical protein